MKNIKLEHNLTSEELEMEANVNWGNVQPATPEQKEEWAAIARNTLAKNKTITVHLSERTLLRLKAKAAREGLPYQTFITSLIHKNV